MNLQSIVVVALRLLALDFLLRVALEMVDLLPKVMRLVENSARFGSASDVAVPLVMTIGFVLCGVGLWVFALPIARLVSKQVPQEVSLGALTLADCYSVAFIGVGLLYIANGVPQVLNWSHYLFRMAASTPGNGWKDQVNFYQVSQVFLSFVFGVVLFVKGRTWAVALARRHEKSGRQSTPVEPPAASPQAHR
jgi:hypothetical protein